MEIISLNGIWHLEGKNQNDSTQKTISLEATVPGCVQLDLSQQGYLPQDLFMGNNIKEAEKFECYEWWYTRTFTAPTQRKHIFLVFEAVDCFAEYFLNDIKIGESENAFISHEFQIDEYLQDGENILTVHIKSPIIEAEIRDYPLRLIYTANTEGCWIRKPPHSYGWDIMPRAVTSGLWRDVKLEVRDDIYFSQIFIQTGMDVHPTFIYALETDYEDLSDVEIFLEGACGDSLVSGRKQCRIRRGAFWFDISNPKLWFPYGYGEPNIYDCTASIYKAGKLVHQQKLSFGIRTVVLDRRDPDGFDNGQFRFLINGVEIMCKGSNWVPLDAFHSRDAQRYDEALSLAKDIGCNILRCWGGNVYEDHKFFDFCDRNGIMVWQDFAMACCQYPYHQDFIQNLNNEITSVIRKLRNHPSLILWAGDNEIDACFPQFDPNDNIISRITIPQCVRDNDLGRPYLPSSPYISPEMYAAGQRSQVYGTKLPEEHLWGPRDYFKSKYYQDNNAHFISETGYHGCPSLESIKKFIEPDYVWPYHNNPQWTFHSSDQNGNDSRIRLMENQVRQLFGYVPTEPLEYILASQISQAEAKKYFIERMRVGRPDKTGIIWWNLLDGWPQMSDAVVDYYFNKKLAYSYIKRSQAPFVIAADEIAYNCLPVYACNDTLEDKKGRLVVLDGYTDEIIYQGDFSAARNSSTLIAHIPIYFSDQKILIFQWEIDTEQGFNHYLSGHPPISMSLYKTVMQKYNF